MSACDYVKGIVVSFHEKSAWACLGSILLVFVPFFLLVFSTPGYPIVVPAFIGAVVVLVLIQTLLHIVFAVTSARIRRTGDVPARDEREIGIDLRSTKVASIVLGTVVMIWCLAAYAGIPISRIQQHQAMADTGVAPAVEIEATPDVDVANLSLSNLLPVPAHDALFFVHILFAGFVLANVVYYAAIVYGYRRAV